MKLIVGLGNPGVQYKWTRHNIGFEVIDRFASENNINLTKNKFESIYGEGQIEGEKFILVKPLTYMNLSGKAIKNFLKFFKNLNLSDLIVICDDINIPVGNIKIKLKGSYGGQNGLKNIIDHLETDEFCRIRVGIGPKPDGVILSSFVLGKFNKNESYPITNAIKDTTSAISIILKEKNIDTAMNKFNKKIDNSKVQINRIL